MAQFSREGLVVARQPGTRLFLAGVSGMAPSFEGLSHRTIFFSPDEVDERLRAMKVDPESVELVESSLHGDIGVEALAE